MSIPVYLEVGSTKTFACALDWPGWCRSGKTPDAALETLADYARRYRPVAEAAGARFPTSAGGAFDVVERRAGSGATDFGALDGPAQADFTPLTKARAERNAAIVEASWALLDRVAADSPEQLRKGPRGGGRDRTKMLTHVLESEVSYVRTIGLRLKAPAPDDHGAVRAVRTAIADALRAARNPVPDVKGAWPYRYAARRIAWHTLDHAWEMEDRRL